LRQQDQLYAPPTRRLFTSAGIGPGMRVLDIGCGAGDVALLAADLVGPTGAVVGVDRDRAILETARTRAAATDLTNVAFVPGDLPDIEVDGAFDAIVGRFVLMYLPDPAEAIRALLPRLRPGGVVAFLEFDFTYPPVGAHPASPLLVQMMSWLRQTSARIGAEMAMGMQLAPVYLRAGLPVPHQEATAPVGCGPDWPGYDYIAASLRSFLPLAIRFGFTTAEEAHVETFAARLRREVEAHDAVVMAPLEIGAWARA
jgi:SAM-dependent methyltransferase